MCRETGWAKGSHTLTIEAPGRQNAAATSALIVVDAFDVPGPAVSPLQEKEPDISYSAGWSQGDTRRAWGARIAAVSPAPGAQAPFTLPATSLSWNGARRPHTGLAHAAIHRKAVTEPADSSLGPQAMNRSGSPYRTRRRINMRKTSWIPRSWKRPRTQEVRSLPTRKTPKPRYRRNSGSCPAPPGPPR